MEIVKHLRLVKEAEASIWMSLYLTVLFVPVTASCCIYITTYIPI